jgi:putative transposase
MRYRRATIPGACYFFTVNLAERNKSLLVDTINVLRSAFKQVKKNHAFTISAIVVLPDHLHTIWQLPENDADYPTRWNLIKRSFSRALPKTERISNSRRIKGERGIWQRRYWEHMIKDENDFEQHVNYIHFNPVKHGYVQAPADWPYSSIHQYIRNDVLQANWASSLPEGDLGERRT